MLNKYKVQISAPNKDSLFTMDVIIIAGNEWDAAARAYQHALDSDLSEPSVIGVQLSEERKTKPKPFNIHAVIEGDDYQ